MAAPGPPRIYRQAAGFYNALQFWWEYPLNDNGRTSSFTLTCLNPDITLGALSTTSHRNCDTAYLYPVQNSVNYKFTVTANNVFGSSPAVKYNDVSAGLPPDIISTTTVKVVSDNETVITWTCNPITNQQLLHSYILYVIPENGLSTIRYPMHLYQSSITLYSHNYYKYYSTTNYAYAVVPVGTGAAYGRKDPQTDFIPLIGPRPFKNPLLIPNCVQWLDGSDPDGSGANPYITGDLINTWIDKTGLNHSLTSTIGSSTSPTYSESSGLPAVNFTNSSGLMTASSFLKSTDVTFFMVAIVSSATQHKATFWGHYNSATESTDIQLRSISTGTAPPYNNLMNWATNNDTSFGQVIKNDVPALYSAYLSTGNSVFLQETNSDGTYSNTIGQNNTLTPNLGNVYVGLGLNDQAPINSYIAETIYYQSVLSESDRQLIEGYLAWKYPPLNTYLPDDHPYNKVPPTYQPKVPPIPDTGSSTIGGIGQSNFSTIFRTNTETSSYSIVYSEYNPLSSVTTITIPSPNIPTDVGIPVTNLEPGTMYYYTIIGTNLMGSTSTSIRSTLTISNYPIGIQRTSVTQSTLGLTWRPATGASSYTYILQTPVGTIISTVNKSNAPPVNLSPLTAGSSYTFSIQTNNASGSSGYSPGQSYTTLANPAINISSSYIGTSSINVAWTDAAGASSLTFVYNNQQTTINAATTFSPYQISPLSTGTGYVFNIISNTLGGAVTSNSVTISTYRVSGPFFLSPLPSSSVTSIQFSWTNATLASSYTYWLGTNPSDPTQPDNRSGTVPYTQSTVTISTINNYTLSSGTAYYAQVIATNLAGNTTAFATGGGTIQEYYTLELPPGPIIQSNNSQSSMTLSWTPHPASSYTYTISTANGLIYSSTVGSSVYSATVNNLYAGSTLYIGVIATETSGDSRPAENTFTTLAFPPVITAISSITGVSFFVAWSNAQGVSSLTFNTTTGPVYTVNANTVSNPYQIVGLTAGTPYNTYITANTLGGSVNSATSTVTTVGVPSAFSVNYPASATTINSLQFSWATSANASSYTYSLGTNSSDPALSPVQTTTVAAPTQTSNVIGTLSPATTYYTKVVAQNIAGSATTPIQSFVTISDPPTSLGANTYTNNSINFYWSNPSGTLSSNTYFWSQNVVNISVNTATVQSGTTNASVASLQDNTSTYFMVLTNTRGGASGLSPVYATLTAPNAPTLLPVTNISYTSATLNWSYSGNGSITTYIYTFGASPNPTSNQTTVNATSATINTVSIGYSTTVYYTVTANNGNNSAQASGTFTSGEPPVPPTPITSMSATSEPETTTVTATINWTGGNFVSSYTYFLNDVQTVPAIDNGIITKSATFRGLTPATTYRISLIGINYVGSTIFLYNPTTPIQAFGGARLWFDGADPLGTGTPPANNTILNRWFDKSGNGYNTTSIGTTDTTPGNITYSSGNGINFPGRTYFNLPDGSGLTGNPAYSIYFVGLWSVGENQSAFAIGSESGGGGPGLWNYTGTAYFNAGGSNGNLNNTGFNINERHQINYVYNPGVTITSVFDGTTGAVKSNPSPMNTIIYNNYLGFGQASPLIGYISELLVYNVTHNTATRQAIEGYLAWKWNTKSYLPTNHPYYSTSPGFIFTTTKLYPDPPILTQNIAATQRSTIAVNWDAPGSNTVSFLVNNQTYGPISTITTQPYQLGNNQLTPNTGYLVGITANGNGRSESTFVQMSSGLLPPAQSGSFTVILVPSQINLFSLDGISNWSTFKIPSDHGGFIDPYYRPTFSSDNVNIYIAARYGAIGSGPNNYDSRLFFYSNALIPTANTWLPVNPTGYPTVAALNAAFAPNHSNGTTCTDNITSMVFGNGKWVIFFEVNFNGNLGANCYWTNSLSGPFTQIRTDYGKLGKVVTYNAGANRFYSNPQDAITSVPMYYADANSQLDVSGNWLPVSFTTTYQFFGTPQSPPPNAALYTLPNSHWTADNGKFGSELLMVVAGSPWIDGAGNVRAIPIYYNTDSTGTAFSNSLITWPNAAGNTTTYYPYSLDGITAFNSSNWTPNLNPWTYQSPLAGSSFRLGSGPSPIGLVYVPTATSQVNAGFYIALAITRGQSGDTQGWFYGLYYSSDGKAWSQMQTSFDSTTGQALLKIYGFDFASSPNVGGSHLRWKNGTFIMSNYYVNSYYQSIISYDGKSWRNNDNLNNTLSTLSYTAGSPLPVGPNMYL